MIGVGLAISTLGPPWPLWIGHGLFIGLIGLGGINAPMYIYVSRWFDRRRGSALALISSGSYLAGAMWPPVFERAIADFGWRQTMLWYALAEIVVIVPLAADLFSRAAGTHSPGRVADSAARKGTRARLAAESGVRRRCAPPRFCAASRWRCRKAIWSRSAATSASAARSAR